MTSVETSEEGADQPTYQARIRVAHNHSIGPVEERQAERHRDFEKNLKRNGYSVSLASITLAAALGAWSIPCASQDGERPSGRNVFPTKVIRTHRPHITDDFFKQEAVRFERTVAIRSARRPRGGRWACGQRAFIALRNLLEGKSITCRFKHVMVPPKAVCWVGDSDVTHLLLSQG